MKRVLVVEDEPVIQALIAASLEGECQVDAVADGWTAVETAHTMPDLILLDLGLPGLSGSEVLRQLREDAVTAPIPVVLLTGMEPPEGVESDGVLLKPFTPAALRESVSGWLS